MKLPPIPFVVLDTETTGFVPRVHRIIEFASIGIRDGKIAATFEQLFSTGGEVPPQVEVLTRIKSKDLAGKPTFGEMRAELEKHLPEGSVLVGQNLSFDLSMLKGEGMDLSGRPWIDTSLLASLVFPELKSYSLGYMSTALALNHEPAHRAMGDVRATLELLGKIWERLLELPPDLATTAKGYLCRSTPGYRMLFEALEATGKSAPAWMRSLKGKTASDSPASPVSFVTPPPGVVALHEESLHPASLQVILDAADKDKNTHWIAVKNLESAVRKIRLPEDVRVIHPPLLILDPVAVERLRAQESFSAEEALLITKIDWFRPRLRAEIAVHGGERDVWNGKLACTETSEAYTGQFTAKASSFVLDHRQLLAFLADPAHAAHGALSGDAHIVIDDASMLEDTATKAYGHFCAIDELQAASQGHALLTKLADLTALWAEQTRGTEDTHLLTPADLSRSETKSMREQLDSFILDTTLPERTLHLLRELRCLLEMKTFAGEVRWIEIKPNRSIHLHGAPERVDALLRTSLYDRFPTTLIVPDGSNDFLPEVLPSTQKTMHADPLPLPPETVAVTFREDAKIPDILRNPPSGRTVVLASSKRLIEQLFVQCTEELEAKGVTMICQGLSGGQGRMEAEFLAATTPVLWLLTPWMYEGIELLEGGIDHLILETVPFDHPGYPVLARRKNHYKNSFEEYCLPRVEHRLFRLLRTFCRHRNPGGDMTILDQRLRDRGYGPRIRSYVETIARGEKQPSQAPAKTVVKTKKSSGQQTLF